MASAKSMDAVERTWLNVELDLTVSSLECHSPGDLLRRTCYLRHCPQESGTQKLRFPENATFSPGAVSGCSTIWFALK